MAVLSSEGMVDQNNAGLTVLCHGLACWWPVCSAPCRAVGVGACRLGQGGPALPWKCCKMFFFSANVVWSLSWRSTVFVHYFSSTSGKFAPRPPSGLQPKTPLKTGLHPGATLREIPQMVRSPNLLIPVDKSCERTWALDDDDAIACHLYKT